MQDHPTLTNEQVVRTETKQRNNETNKCCDSKEPNIYLQNISPKHKKNIHTFPVPHGTFSKTDHILSHKGNLNRYKKIEITPCIQSDHHELKLDINNRNNKKNYKLMETEQLSIVSGSRKK